MLVGIYRAFYFGEPYRVSKEFCQYSGVQGCASSGPDESREFGVLGLGR